MPCSDVCKVETVHEETCNGNLHLALVRAFDAAIGGIKDTIAKQADLAKVKIFDEEVVNSLLIATQGFATQIISARRALFQGDSDLAENPVQYVQPRVNLYWMYSEACSRLEEAVSCGLAGCEKAALLVARAFDKIFSTFPGLEFENLGRAIANIRRCHNIRGYVNQEGAGDLLVCTNLGACLRLAAGAPSRLAKEIIKGDVLDVLFKQAYNDPFKKVRDQSCGFLTATIFSEHNLKGFFGDTISDESEALLNALLSLDPSNDDVDIISRLHAINTFLCRVGRYKDSIKDPKLINTITESILKKFLNLQYPDNRSAAVALDGVISIMSSPMNKELVDNSRDILYNFVLAITSNEIVKIAKLERFIMQCLSLFDMEHCTSLANELLLRTLRGSVRLAQISMRLSIRFNGLRNTLKSILSVYTQTKEHYVDRPPVELADAIVSELHAAQSSLVADCLRDCIGTTSGPSLTTLTLIEAILRSGKCSSALAEAIHFLEGLISESHMTSYLNHTAIETALCSVMVAITLYPSECLGFHRGLLPKLIFHLTTNPRCAYISGIIILHIFESGSQSDSSTLVSKLLDLCDADAAVRWDGRFSTLTDQTLPVALWNAILKHIPAMEVYCEPDVINRLASFIVSHLRVSEDHPLDSLSKMSSLAVGDISFFEMKRISAAYTSNIVSTILSECKPGAASSENALVLPNLLKHLILIPPVRLRPYVEASTFLVLQSFLDSLPDAPPSLGVSTTPVDNCICLCNCLCALSIRSLSSSSKVPASSTNSAEEDDFQKFWIDSAADVFSKAARQPRSDQLDAAKGALLAEVSHFFSHAHPSPHIAQVAISITRNAIALSSSNAHDLYLGGISYLGNLPKHLVDDDILKQMGPLLTSILEEIIIRMRELTKTENDSLIVLKLARAALQCLRIPHARGNLRPIAKCKIGVIAESLSLALEDGIAPASFLPAALLIELASEVDIKRMLNMIPLFYHFPAANGLVHADENLSQYEIIMGASESISRMIKRAPVEELSAYFSDLGAHFCSLSSGVVRTSFSKSPSEASPAEKCLYGLIALAHSSFNALPASRPDLRIVTSSILQSLCTASTFITPYTLIRLFDLERCIMQIRRLHLQPSDAHVVLSTCSSVLLRTLSPRSRYHHRQFPTCINAFNSLCALVSSLAFKKFRLIKKFIPSFIIVFKQLVESLLALRPSSSNGKIASTSTPIPQDSAREVLYLSTALGAKPIRKKFSTEKANLKKTFSRHISILLSCMLAMQNSSKHLDPSATKFINSVILSLLKNCPRSCLDSAMSTIPASCSQREIHGSLIKELDKKYRYKGQF